MFIKVFEKLVNNRIVDHLEKWGYFYYFQYGFRSSRSTADLLAVASNRIARAFNRSGATQVVALDISKAFDKVLPGATQAVALDISNAFDRVLHAGFLQKLKSYRIPGQIFCLISLFPVVLMILLSTISVITLILKQTNTNRSLNDTLSWCLIDV